MSEKAWLQLLAILLAICFAICVIAIGLERA
jgi:hypothetical protein